MMKLVKYEWIKWYRKKTTLGLFLICIAAPLLFTIVLGPREEYGNKGVVSSIPIEDLQEYEQPFTAEVAKQYEQQLASLINVEELREKAKEAYADIAYTEDELHSYGMLYMILTEEGYFGSFDDVMSEETVTNMSEEQRTVMVVLDYLMDYEKNTTPYEQFLDEDAASYIDFIMGRYALKSYTYGTDYYVYSYLKTMLVPMVLLLYFFFALGSTSFAQESNGADALLLTSKWGKKRLVLVKIAALLLHTIVVTCVVLGLYLLIFASFHHLLAFPDAPYGNRLPEVMLTNQQVLILSQLSYLFIMLIGSIFAMACSGIFRHAVPSFVCCFLLFFLPLFFVSEVLQFHSSLDYTLWDALPTLFYPEALLVQYFHVQNLVFLPFFQTYLASVWFPYLLWTPILILLILLSIRRWYRWQVTS